MKIRNRKSYLNSLPEGKAPESGLSKIVHWAYFLLLAAIVIYFVRYAYLRLTGIEGYGEVVVEQIVLSAGYGGHVAHLPVVENQEVKKGELLVQIDSLKTCSLKDRAYSLKLKLDSEIKKARIKVLKRKLKEINSEQRIRRALELNNRATRTDPDLPYEIALLEKELSIQRDLLGNLTRSEPQRISGECMDEMIYSPFDAVVKRILKKTHEFAERAESVVIIESKQASVQIEGYFSKYDLESVSIDKKMTINFPDGSEGYGYIKEIHSAAYAFPQREWEGYEPSDSRVRVHLLPVDERQAEKWKRYDLLRVQIRGSMS